MKYISFYIVLILSVILSSCGGGSSNNTSSNDDSSSDGSSSNVFKREKKLSSEDAKANALAVRSLFYRNNGKSTRKFKRNEVNSGSEIVACANNEGTVTTNINTAAENNAALGVYQQNYINCKNDTGNIYHGIATGVLGLNEEEFSLDVITAIIYDGFSIKYKNKFRKQSFGITAFSPFASKFEDSIYDLNVAFATPTDTVNLYGGYFLELKQRLENNKKISTLKSSIEPDLASFYKILGKDGSGAEWTKLDISYRLEEAVNNEADSNFKFSVNTDQTIITKDCSNQYETRTIKPITITGDNNISGEITFRSKSDGLLTKLLIIDSEKVELSADFDNDGVSDYKKILSWDEVFSKTSNSPKYDICR